MQLPSHLIAELGTKPDYRLAQENGVSKFVVARARREAGIPSYAERTGNDGRIDSDRATQRRKPLAEEIERLLGTIPDYQVAKLASRSVISIKNYRRSLSIKAMKAPKGGAAASGVPLR